MPHPRALPRVNVPLLLLFLLQIGTEGGGAEEGVLRAAEGQLCQSKSNIIAEDGTLSDGSPIGDSYVPGTDCQFLIVGGTKNRVFIQFIRFDVAPGDTLYVYDGPNLISNQVGGYTGRALPPEYQTKEDSLTLWFVVGKK
mmetsp:Transcript_9895/g.32094  ORF Transcript_9895/g.32094 Transcript_9895/m.32094 type:complete len:140 (-) Transcript_9895:97-516(-)